MKLDEGVAAASEGNVGHWKWLNVQFTLTFLAECRAENRTCGGGSAGVGWENVSFLKFPRTSHDPCVCFKLVYSGEKVSNTHYLLVAIIRKIHYPESNISLPICRRLLSSLQCFTSWRAAALEACAGDPGYFMSRSSTFLALCATEHFPRYLMFL